MNDACNVVNLNGERPSITGNPDLVEMMEELLARVKSGSITAMAVAFVNLDGRVSTRWGGGDQTIPMIAAISLLHNEFLSGARLCR